jgi:hypothetical protein
LDSLPTASKKTCGEWRESDAAINQSNVIID